MQAAGHGWKSHVVLHLEGCSVYAVAVYKSECETNQTSIFIVWRKLEHTGSTETQLELKRHASWQNQGLL